MSRAKIAGEVTRKSETAGMPDHSAVLICGEYLVFKKMATFGARGVTTRDFAGWDLRHYIRNLKKKGVAISEQWEADELSRHKRWRLKSGHAHKEIPYPKKTKSPTVAPVTTSNSNPLRQNKGGSNDA